MRATHCRSERPDATPGAMGCFGSKNKISKVDLEYLKQHTRYDEATIKEWFKGFRVSVARVRRPGPVT